MCVWSSFRCARIRNSSFRDGHSCNVLAKVKINLSNVQHLSGKVL